MREKVRLLTDLPNIGKASEKDLQLLGIVIPTNSLIGRSPYAMRATLSLQSGL
ncbi:MAG: hypothetical protein ACI8R9_002449 [Paraglaciecola sp.]|jgi:hypothetical protein